MAPVAQKRQTRLTRLDSQIAPEKKPGKANILRVIAPFVRLQKKTEPEKPEKKDEQFSFYLKKKPEVLLKDLSSFMSDSVDLPSLFHETGDVLQKVTKASWVTLYMVDSATNEIYISVRHPIKDRHRVKWPIEDTGLVAAYVAKYKEYVMLDDILCDTRFPRGIGYDGSSIPKSVMCIPISTKAGDCFAVYEFVKTINKPAFQQNDLKICVMVTAWMGVAIHQNQERLALQRQQELNDYLLDLVRCYFEDHVIVEKLMCEVIKFARVTLGAERGSFFIIDQESDEMIAHLFDEGAESETSQSKRVRFSRERGIAGLVSRTGVSVNIKDAYKDSRFNKDIDQKTGFITRSILCLPILGSKGVLGVVQVVNKKNGGCFSVADENLFKTFSLYCSLALHYTGVNTETEKLKHENTIILKTLSLQQVPCIHDSQFFAGKKFIPMPEDFNSFYWYVAKEDELRYAPQYILFMMTDLVDREDINMEPMLQFILTVRKFYRDIPYHNFEHAFNVYHCMYVILKRNTSRFTKLEVKALMVACICHDLDHFGYTNNFLQVKNDDLAMLYESSVLENHHWRMTLMLLEQHTIFKNFTEQTTALFHKEIETAILATDLALYFDCRTTLLNILNGKTFTWSNTLHRHNVKAIMMNSCDLSGSSKPFLTARRITENLYMEFYRQGDMEKEMGACVLSIMDREKSDLIPFDQIKFLNVVVIPCMELLRSVLPNTRDLYLGAVMLRNVWQDILDTRGKKIWRQDDSIVYNIRY